MSEMRLSNEFDTLFPLDMDLSGLRIVIIESSENRLIVKAVKKDLQDKLALYNNAALDLDEVYITSAWQIPYTVGEVYRQHGQRFDPFPIIVVLACLIEESIPTDFRSLCDSISSSLMRVSIDNNIPLVNGVIMAATELQAERICQGRGSSLTGNHETFGGELATEAICLPGIRRVIKNLDADEDIKTEDSEARGERNEEYLYALVGNFVLNCTGKEGKLPWKSLPEDMKRFKNITIGKSPQENKNVCIMGRKTWESIPERFRPLKDRINVVISTTTSTGDYPDEVRISRSLQEALERLKEEKDNHGEIFVIGGASLIKEAMNLPECRTMYTTRVGIDPWECDVIIDKINEHVWEPISVSKTFSHDGIPYDFVDYRRKENGKVCETLLAECRPKSRFQHDEYEYLRLIEDIIENGEESDNRTGVGTRTIFSCHMRFSLRDGVFPLLTTKRVFWRGVLEELLWFIKGDTNAKHLSDRGVKIWDLNGTREFLDGRGLSHREEGDLGPVYGFQWRHFGAEYVDMHTDYSDGVDQLAQVIKQLKENPTDRRIIMSAWNPQALPLMALPPCHVMCHFYVNAKRELSCAMYQRSADMGLGVPFNIASYSLLTYMLAQVCDLKPGEFCHHLGNTHVYENHIEPLREQLKRTPKPFPLLKINPDIKCIDDFKASDFELVGYNPWGKIPMQMAVPHGPGPAFEALRAAKLGLSI
ncbi:hypothetical protein FOL47_007170 [Perkinsus chesapeaki]|uniref:Bifunctional dihydrofolate reductase-thymidylate synthase n=1 Tax=Perkinsus chesapeaki TaxID=330153 RepID=A0A7J6LMD7_PERCH|nr:hypothetical protein FOL47_007170 [Perkinsus chesapeaki]